MSKSAFEQKQVANASESAAGSVQEATALQVAQGIDTGSTGARLFVPPSKIQQGVGSITGFTAYEAITAGDIVGISHYTPVDTAQYFTNVANKDSQVSDFTNVNWYAQRFTVPATHTDGTPITRIHNIQAFIATNAAAGFTMKLRASLTGPDLWSVNFTNNYANVFTLHNMGNPQPYLTPGGTYYLILLETTVTDAFLQWGYSSTNTNPPPGGSGEAWSSTDSGVSWTQLSDRNFSIVFGLTHNNSLGHFNVYKAWANGSPANNNRFGFAGVALNNAAPGEEVVISNAFSQDLFAGLTPGINYYMSESVAGQIQTVPGTNKVWLGRAVSSTKLVRPPSMPLSFFIVNPGAGWYHIAGQYENGVLGVTSQHYCRIQPPQISNGENGMVDYSAARGASFMCNPGDYIAPNSTHYFSPLIAIN